jgi:hypothetical protein
LENLDLEHKRIQMCLPDGMLDVNAPLTEEEKEQQAGGPRNKKVEPQS